MKAKLHLKNILAPFPAALPHSPEVDVYVLLLEISVETSRDKVVWRHVTLVMKYRQ